MLKIQKGLERIEDIRLTQPYLTNSTSSFIPGDNDSIAIMNRVPLFSVFMDEICEWIKTSHGYNKLSTNFDDSRICYSRMSSKFLGKENASSDKMV